MEGVKGGKVEKKGNVTNNFCDGVRAIIFYTRSSCSG